VARVVFAPNLERHVSAPPAEVGGSSVREVLDRVFHDNPLLRGHVVDDQGRLRKQVVVFVNGQMIDDRVALTDDIVETDEVFVMQAQSGG